MKNDLVYCDFIVLQIITDSQCSIHTHTHTYKHTNTYKQTHPHTYRCAAILGREMQHRITTDILKRKHIHHIPLENKNESKNDIMQFDERREK